MNGDRTRRGRDFASFVDRAFFCRLQSSSTQIELKALGDRILNPISVLGDKNPLKLADALSYYVTSSRTSFGEDVHGHLRRFGSWVGWERVVTEIPPSEVARYAEELAGNGGDVHSRVTPVKLFLTFLKRNGVLKDGLAAHMRIPRTSKKFAVSKVPDETKQMTAEGHKALVGELANRKDDRTEIADQIRLARSDKDVSENAPLDAARERQGINEARIKELEANLRLATVIGKGASIKAPGAHVGSRVVLEELTSGKKTNYLLVDSMESDPLQGKLSVVSPVGKAVMGKSTGDSIEVTVPKGMTRYKILSVAG